METRSNALLRSTALLRSRRCRATRFNVQGKTEAVQSNRATVREQKVGGNLIPLWKRGNKGDLIVWRGRFLCIGLSYEPMGAVGGKKSPSPLFFKGKRSRLNAGRGSKLSHGAVRPGYNHLPKQPVSSCLPLRRQHCTRVFPWRESSKNRRCSQRPSTSGEVSNCPCRRRGRRCGFPASIRPIASEAV